MPSKIKRLQDFCDMDKLYSMLDNWAMSTGMSVSIIDNQGELISDVFGMSDYCKMVQSTKKGKEDCKSCIQRANGLFLCHAGFCEFSSTISLPDGTILGKVLAGQVLSEIQKDDQLLNTATALGIHEDKAKKCIARLKRRSFKEMEGAYSLLDDMIHFFIEDRYSIWKAKQENQEEKYRQMQTIQAFSSIYFATWSIDLERNYVESIKEPDFVRPLAEVTDRTVSDAIHMLIERSIPDQKEMMRDKLNMSEIIKQLEKSEKVELEYCDFAIGWCRITIIPIEKIKEQRVSKLLIGIQSIEAEKKKEQKATTELKEINEVATKYNAFHDAITQKIFVNIMWILEIIHSTPLR